VQRPGAARGLLDRLSAYRDGFEAEMRLDAVGFRVARTLSRSESVTPLTLDLFTSWGLGRSPSRFLWGKELTERRRLTAARHTGPALEAMYRFILWLVPTVEKFPRSQKFLLGDRIQTTALDVLERLIDATYTRP
jgi:hypothetical protein